MLTDEKLVIMGAAGMIGSNMAQCVLMMGLSSNLCLYDPYEKGLEGVAKEMMQSGFWAGNITYTSDIKEALTGAKYIVSSGGAPRKAGMTREDLLKGNAEIAAQMGEDIKSYCPDVKHVVVVFNPADITGLIMLVHSGIAPQCVSTLAALDSTRLTCALSNHFGIPARDITGCKTYGGHGEQMAVFASSTKIKGIPLLDLIGTHELTIDQWNDIKERVIQGGKEIIELRGRSSFQSPAYLSIEMIAAAMGGKIFHFPAGAYVDNDKYKHILMALDTEITNEGVKIKEMKGTPEEIAELDKSYEHLCSLRDEVIQMGILPPTDKWHEINKNL